MFCSSYAFTQNTLPPTGNVGIGTTTPAASLDVVGNTNLGGAVTIDSAVTVRDSATFQKKLTVDQDLKIKGTSVFVDNANFKSDLKVLGVAKMKDKLVVDGLTRMNGDANVFGNFRIKSLADSTFSTDRLLSINPNGRIVLSNLTIPQDDTFVCSYVTPWIFANGTTTDDDIALCPNFKSVTIAGDLTIGGITRLNTTGIGVAADNNTQLNIRSVGKEVSMRLFTVPTTATKYAFQNRITTPTIIAYSVTNHTTNQDVFVVKGDGSVGIGTDNPDFSKLNVVAQNETGLTVTTNHTGDYGYGIRSMVAKNKTKAFAVFNAEGNEESFIVHGNGYVYATKVIVQETPFPDYVFKSNYKLMPLNELEKYIVTNKHLPNMPTADEIESNGADLGEINRILVEKVEELTLYLIELQKNYNLLQEKVIQIEKRNY